MNKSSREIEGLYIIILFFVSPSLLLIFGFLFFPYPSSEILITLVQIPMFLGLILLGVGFLARKYKLSIKIKMLGWIVFSFYWSTQPNTLYFSENGDIFNASLCVIGVFILFYFAYHEWLSLKKNEEIICLDWIAGSSAIAGLIYFGIERSLLASKLIEIVARQSVFVLNQIVGNIEIYGHNIYYNGEYCVTIIFACTALQSIVLFIGMILALTNVHWKRKVIGLVITVIPIYILNLFRNAMVTYLLGENITDFYLAHNVIAKVGSLIALIAILFIVSKILPEIFDQIFGIMDLPKRNGPIEKFFKSIFGDNEKA